MNNRRLSDYILESFDFSGDAMELASHFRDEPFLFFFDSSLNNKERGRYSLIGFDPFEVFSAKDTNCLPELRRRFQRFRMTPSEASVPLVAGMVGFLGYDFGFQLEDIKRHTKDDLHLPDCYFGFYDCVLTVDHFQKKLYVTSTGLPETQSSLTQRRAQERLKRIVEKLPKAGDRHPWCLSPAFESDSNAMNFSQESSLVYSFTKDKYLKAVGKALEHIRRGDIYQVNLSQRFSFVLDDHHPIDSLELYRSLRQFSPSCFSAYFNTGDFQILSSSPEQFLKKRGNILETRPMKGTRPRGKTSQEDRQWRDDLLQSSKEIAELLMVTDLERNDLGRVCEYGSVNVKALRTLEEYSTVFQTTAAIEGILRKDKDCFDALAACFPSGSVTGCPKIRAMEIIEELEPVRRAYFTGALGYIGFNGDMDFNVLIRTLLVNKHGIHFYVGGGIVADSIPEKEYEETLIKARAMVRAVDSLRSSGNWKLPTRHPVAFEEFPGLKSWGVAK